MDEGQIKCPKCLDDGVIQKRFGPKVFRWIILDCTYKDGSDIEIDYCPWCGFKLPE